MATPRPQARPIDRIQQNLLAVSERRLLTWLCSKTPAAIMPDHLTILGIFGAVMIFAGYTASLTADGWLWLAIAGYFVQWLGDSLDGSLARFRKIERPSYGYFIDHSCDGIATLLILGGMGLSPYVRLDIALFALIGYLLMSIHVFLSARVLSEVRLSYVAFGPTELRFVLIGLTLIMMFGGDKARHVSAINGFDIAVGIAGALLVGLFVFQTLYTGRRLARMERRG
ncbi:MAG TPA: CDP-alcohol phosphatidyltransferase family protein [Sphingomicrobium sp.]|jgi:phosphatidylglycerophosphate synthase|nr:CDP-alcohol phosphatidyltransferase family protein [Sphingomicrobium sp.]